MDVRGGVAGPPLCLVFVLITMLSEVAQGTQSTQ